MTFSTKNRNAVNAMLELMLNEKDGLVTLSEISEAQGISMSYLEQLFAGLRKHKLVQGARGPGGGYQLGKAPSEISIADIHFAVEGHDVKPDVITGRGNYDQIQKMWGSVSERFYAFLGDVRLEKLAGKSVKWERKNLNEIEKGRIFSDLTGDTAKDQIKLAAYAKAKSASKRRQSEKDKNAVPDELWQVAISGIRMGATGGLNS